MGDDDYRMLTMTAERRLYGSGRVFPPIRHAGKGVLMPAKAGPSLDNLCKDIVGVFCRAGHAASRTLTEDEQRLLNSGNWLCSFAAQTAHEKRQNTSDRGRKLSRVIKAASVNDDGSVAKLSTRIKRLDHLRQLCEAVQTDDALAMQQDIRKYQWSLTVFDGLAHVSKKRPAAGRVSSFKLNLKLECGIGAALRRPAAFPHSSWT